MPTGPPGAYGLPPMPPVQRSASSATSMSGAPRSTSSLPQVKLGGSGGLRRIGSANHSAEVATSLHRQPGSAEYPHYVLAPRISSDSSCSRKSQQLLPSLDIGSYTAPGTRYAGLNQDVVLHQEMYAAGEIPRDGEQTYILAVCDGHGIIGDKSAAVAGKALVRSLYSSSLRNKHLARMHASDIHKELTAAFHKAHASASTIYSQPPKTVEYPATPLDGKLSKFSLAEGEDGRKVYRSTKGTEKMLECGCTATVVVVQGGCVCLANVGDSLAALGHDDGERYSGELITRRHNGRDPEEAARVSASCGCRTQVLEDGYIHVAEGPFAGYELAVTRALGHLNMEEYGVICEPYTRILHLTALNPCLVVASDGLWDVMTADEAVSHVMDSLACGKNAAGAAQALVEHAVALGLTTGEQDNTTALVVSFVTAEQTAGASA